MLLGVFKEWTYSPEQKSPKSGIAVTCLTPCAQLVLMTASDNHKPSTGSQWFPKSEIITESQNLGIQELMGRGPDRAQKWCSSKLVRTIYFPHTLKSFQRVTISPKVKISEYRNWWVAPDALRSTRTEQSLWKPLLSTCFYKFWKSENMTQSQNLGNQEFMGLAPHRAHK